MNSHRALLLAALMLGSAGILPAGPRTSKNQFAETGTLMEMQAVPCGSKERGLTGLGGFLATAGIEHVNARDKLCQEYVLRTSYLQYRIRPIHDHEPLLPVGERAVFRIRKDHILLSVPEGDDKVREYRVVAMVPLVSAQASERYSAVRALARAAAPPRRVLALPPPSAAAVPPAPAPAETQKAAPAADHQPSGAQLKQSTPVPAGTAAETSAAASAPAAADSAPPASSSSTPSDPAGSAPSAAAASAPPADSAPPAAGSSPPADPAGSPPVREATERLIPQNPLNSIQVMGLVKGGVANRRVATLVRERGISFRPSGRYLAELRRSGANEALIGALRTAGSAAQTVAARSPSGSPSSAAADQADSTGGGDFTAGHDPDDAFVRAEVAAKMAAANDSAGAVREYRQALAIAPHQPGFHDNLGVALSRRGDFGGAVSEFREALREDPADVQAHINLGAVLQQHDDLDGAIRQYRQARTLPGGAAASYNLATALETKGDVGGAITEFRQALAAAPRDARAHAGLASALARVGDSAGASAQYRIALQLAPGDPAIRSEYNAFLKRVQAKSETTAIR